MPDAKITALASIGTGTDPANDPLVIVDVSDVAPGGMSATGTTKKVTLNNLLASGPAATLSSATITGAATVGTTLGVTGSFTSYTGQNPSAIRAAASDYAAAAFDGTTTFTRITSTLTGQNIGTGDFSLWSRFRVPVLAAFAISPAVITIGPNATDGAGNNSCRLTLLSGGTLSFRINDSGGATTSGDIANFSTNFSGQVVDVVVTRTGSTLKIYINGTDTAYTGTPAASTSINSVYCHTGLGGSGSAVFTGRIYRSVVFNRALSASDVTELITTGVNPADQWGTQTAAYTSDFSAGVDGWAAIGGTAAGNIDGIGGQDNNLRYTISSGANNADGASKNNVVIPSKRYRFNFAYYIPSGQTQITTLRAFVGLTGVVTGLNVTNAWTDVSAEGVASVDTLLRVNQNFVGTGNGTDVFYIRAVTVTRIGAIVDLDLSVGIGLFFPDRSDNRLGGDGFGGISHSMPKEYGSITVVKDLLHSDISATAATTSLFSLPPNCGVMFVELDRVEAFTAGTTVQIGVSGTANKFLAATSVATTGITGANSASLISESNSANTSVFIQKSGATSVGRVRVRVTYQIRG